MIRVNVYVDSRGPHVAAIELSDKIRRCTKSPAVPTRFMNYCLIVRSPVIACPAQSRSIKDCVISVR
jgi:hypothetical protein